MVEEERGPKVLKSKNPKVQRSKGLKDPWSQGPKDQDISKSYSNTILTLKKVHLFQINIIYLPPTPGVPISEKFMDKAFKSIKYCLFQKVVILSISIQSFNILPKVTTPSVIPFWRAFLMPMKGARSKVQLSGNF